MFKIFDLKNGKEVTDRYALTSSGSLIDFCGNGEFWSYAKGEDFLIVQYSSLVKENRVFTLIEPGNQDYIIVYKVRGNYIAFNHNKIYDQQGIWYVVSDIKQFKESYKGYYSFIQYNDNYMEEL